MFFKSFNLICLATAIALILGFQSKTSADFIAVNNTGVAESPRQDVSGSSDLAATSFTTGATPYNLVSAAGIFASETPNNETFEASIYSDVSGLPGTLLHTLSGQATLPGSQEQFLTFTSDGYVFAANTTYWVAFRSVNGTSPDQGPIVANNLSQFSPVGWTINDGRGSSTDSGATWIAAGSSALKIEVTVNTDIPEPASLALIACGGMLILGRRRRA